MLEISYFRKPQATLATWMLLTKGGANLLD